MMIFRLISLGFRIIGSFFFVFLLQIQFDGKSLESYLNDFGKKFIVTRTLNKVSEDGVKVIRSFSSSTKTLPEEVRQPLSNSQALRYVKDWKEKITLPPSKEETNSSK